MATPEADFPPNTVYTRHHNNMMILDDAQLSLKCPLDNGRHTGPSKVPTCTMGQLDRLPAELLIVILSYVDIPSLTGLRRVNRRSMELVDSIPQYTTIIQHCPGVIRAVISLQAQAYSLDSLYAVLTSSRCSTCEKFGDRVYLIDCRRVCELCSMRRPEFVPLTYETMWRSFGPMPRPKQDEVFRRQALIVAKNPPSILSLPRRYRPMWPNDTGPDRVGKRFKLFDHKFVAENLGSDRLALVGQDFFHPYRRMTLISAPYISKPGLHADWGYYCLACKWKDDLTDPWPDIKTKYTREGMWEHLAKYGRSNHRQRRSVSPQRSHMRRQIER